MTERLERALQFDRDEIQSGIDEAEATLVDLLAEVRRVEALIAKGRQLLEGGTADLAAGNGARLLTLHEAMRLVLREHDNTPMAARELADEINQLGLYRKRDGSVVEINQIHARAKNYSSIFEKVQNRIRLRHA